MSNLDHIRSYYAALNTGDAELVASHFTDDAVVAWCKPIAGGDARYHVGLRFVWTAAATPNTLRMMAHQFVAGVNTSGAEQAPGGR